MYTRQFSAEWLLQNISKRVQPRKDPGPGVHNYIICSVAGFVGVLEQGNPQTMLDCSPLSLYQLLQEWPLIVKCVL